jgi:hypothetical protein
MYILLQSLFTQIGCIKPDISGGREEEGQVNFLPDLYFISSVIYTYY